MKYFIIIVLLTMYSFSSERIYYYSQQYCNGSSSVYRVWELQLLPDKKFSFKIETGKSQLTFKNDITIKRGNYYISDKYLMLINFEINDTLKFLITDSSLIPLNFKVDTFRNVIFQLDSLKLVDSKTSLD